MKQLWHWLIHRFGWQPCSLVAIIHKNCCTRTGMETACCDWHAVVRCSVCGEETTI